MTSINIQKANTMFNDRIFMVCTCCKKKFTCKQFHDLPLVPSGEKIWNLDGIIMVMRNCDQCGSTLVYNIHS